MKSATHLNFQPMERATPAPSEHLPSRLPGDCGPWSSVDPTNRAPDRTDAMLDAIEKLSVQRIPCRCWVGYSCCEICQPSDPRPNE